MLHHERAQDHEQRLQTEAETLLLELRKSIFLPPVMRRTYLQQHGYRLIEPSPERIKTLHPAFSGIPESYPEVIKESLREGKIQLLRDDHHLYIYLTKATPPLLVMKAGAAEESLWSETLFITLLIALLLFYLLILQTIFPIRKLIDAINRYGTEGKYLPLKSLKKGEIAMVSNALDSAMQKNQSLLEARRLFLRNVMHELKTPITVGKLALPFLKKSEEKSILERAFVRMENLIGELVRVEQITSGMIAPSPKECDPIELIHKAAGLLFIDPDTLEIIDEGGIITVDCDVFVTVFKNFIDNAIKYSPDHHVRIVHKNETITFINRGDPWPAECTLESLTEPFSQKQPTQQGYGLGLYIIKSILDAHHLRLTHHYVSGEHHFCIHFRHN